jgi:transposase-like protein
MKQYHTEEKAKWVEGWKGSRESMSAYAKANGISPQTFTKWVKKGKERREFVEIKKPLVKTGGTVPPGEILIEKGDIRIHLPLNINSPELRGGLEELGTCHDR